MQSGQSNNFNSFQSTYLHKHPQYKNVGVFKCQITQKIFYRGHINVKGRKAEKYTESAEEASKWVDLMCIKNNLKQKNNSYAKKVF